MKKTNIPFCVEIPDTWREVPNKYLFSYCSLKVGSDWRNYQLLSLTTSGVKEKDINSSGGKVPDSYDNYQTVKPGDMIFCLFDLDVSAVFSGLSNLSGMITSAYDVVRPNKELVVQSYIDYWFRYVFSNRYYKMYSKNIRYTIGSDAFSLIKTPIPSIQEQTQIGDYLDKKISEIDNLIGIENKQIGYLKEYKKALATKILKDNTLFGGFLFQKRKFKTLATLCNGKEIPFDGGDVPVYGSGGIFKYTNQVLMDGESLLMGRKGTIDKPLIVFGRFWTVDTMFYTSEFKQCFGKYLYYLCDNLIDFGLYKSGSVLPSMTQTDINNIVFDVAPLNMQEKIAEFIDEKVSVIEKVIAIKNKKIDLLISYKNSLIYECVTGKKELAYEI